MTAKFKQYSITGTKAADHRDTRTLYVIAQDEEEAVRLAEGDNYAAGYEGFKVDRVVEEDAVGPAQVKGMTFDITSRPAH